MNDVDPRLYTTVIRETIPHENNATDHRIMWLLIVQGLIANAAVNVGRESGEIVTEMSAVGILVTLSAFVILDQSYQARGFLPPTAGATRRGVREQRKDQDR